MSKLETIFHELKEHIPFTGSAALIAVLIFATLFSLSPPLTQTVSKSFETIHELHIFVSAIVATGIFYKYKKNIFTSILVGVLSAVIIGTLSDAILPYVGSLALGLNPEFHIPVLEHFWMIFGFGITGCIIGIVTGITKIPHFLHIFLSTLASLFYILEFSSFTLVNFIGIFFVLFIAVIIPCCTSDIVFPVLFLGKKHTH